VSAEYHRLQKGLHWATVLVVFFQLTLAGVNVLAYETRPDLAEAVVTIHVSLGLVIALIVFLRVAVRLILGAPAALEMPVWRRRLVSAVHIALYALLLMMALAGYVKLAALGVSPGFGSVGLLPPLPFDPQLAQVAAQMHQVGGVILIAVIGLHVAGALSHGRAALARMT